MPGTTIECESGRFLAYYDTRSDIIASGESEREAKANLKKLYQIVLKHEKEEEGQPLQEDNLPADFKTRKFTEKVVLK